MPMLIGGVEVFSALEDTSIIEACRMLSITGVCSVCGFGTRGVHAPGVCHGFYCAEHCPVCTGAIEISQQERAAMVANRWRPLTTSTEEKEALLADVQSPKPLRLRARLRIAAVIRRDEHKWRMKRTLHVGQEFTGAGLIPNLIRESDGRLIADIMTEARRVPVAGWRVMEVINQGVEGGTLRLS
jgi:hypothetical protein